MTYLYRNGVEYLVKYKNDCHKTPIIAKPKRFAKGFMSSSKRRDKHAD
jgi:hypothetical protein